MGWISEKEIASTFDYCPWFSKMVDEMQRFCGEIMVNDLALILHLQLLYR